MRARENVKYILVAVTAVLILVAAACSGSNDEKQPTQISETRSTAQPRQGKISPTWIDASVNGDTTSISKNAVDSAGMAHFKVPQFAGQPDLTFMAYTFNGVLQVRADVCVPCRSISFSLDGDKLICDSCGTVFKANSGAGDSGPCRNYPKASVVYQMNGDSIVMKISDLQTAYDDTIKPG